jgi:hypothetical protein
MVCGLTVKTNDIVVIDGIQKIGRPTLINSFNGVSADGRWPFYQPLDGSLPGAVMGWLQFTNTPSGASELTGTLYMK